MLMYSKSLLSLSIVLFSTASQAVSITEISDAARGKPVIQVNAISGDGSVVTGLSENVLDPMNPQLFKREAFRWQSGAIANLPGNLPSSVGNAISTNGTIIAGIADSPATGTRWTTTGSASLPSLGGVGSTFTQSVSGDGSILVGRSPTVAQASKEAFIWSAAGIKPLTGITAGAVSEANDISANGSVIAGTISGIAFRYANINAQTGAGTFSSLGTLAGDTSSSGNGISANGTVIVGESTRTGRSEAFRFINNTMQGLGDLPGGSFLSSANATTADGAITVGTGDSASGTEAFIWDAANGMRRLQDVLSIAGINMTGWVLTEARDISDDGSKIVGVGTKNGVATGWIADLSNTPAADAGPDTGSDFNNDGNDDVLWRNSVTGENAMFLMDGISISKIGLTETLADTNWKIAGVGDFNADGKSDILWRNSATGANMIYLMDGTTVAAQSAITTVADTNWKVAGIGDFNGDGSSDIHWFNSATGGSYIFLMNGVTIASLAPSITAPANWQPVGYGDLDSDNKSDILWRNSITGDNYVLLMNGFDIASKGSITSVADTNWKVVGMGDFDNDDKSDVLWRNSASGQVYIFLMNGIGIKSSGSLVTVGDLNWRPEHVADFNGDNKADIFWRNAVTGQTWMTQLDGISISLSKGVNTVSDLNWKVNGD